MSTQARLFDEGNGSGDDGADHAAPSAPRSRNFPVIKAAGPSAALSKAQREFNRLTQRIVFLQEQTTQWREAAQAHHRGRAKELQPVNAQLLQLQREVVLWIDAYLAQPPGGERLPKKLRTKLVLLIRLLGLAVLEAGADTEIEAAHDRHSVRSHRHQRRDEVEAAAALFSQAMGDADLFQGNAESVDELLQRAMNRLREHGDEDPSAEAAPGAAESSNQRPTREDKARAREASATEAANRSVREVYRRLASTLHPDREPDAEERVRKTDLMARVNEAYGRNDLLALLSMQFGIEQTDSAHLARLPEEHLRRFNRVLKEQAQSMQEELMWEQEPVLAHFGLRAAPKTGASVLFRRMLDDHIDDVRTAFTHLLADADRLRGGRTRLAFLRELDLDDSGIPSPEELWLMQATAEEVAAPSPPRRTRKR
jgi:hypothetical protein